MAKIALITGSNRGLGFEIVRQLAQAGVTALVSARQSEKAKAAQQLLASEGLGESIKVDWVALDVTDPATIESAAKTIEQRYGQLDILVNNAGILPDADSETPGVSVSADTVREVFETNTMGPIQVIQTMLPLLKKSRQAKIINISSELGSLSEMEGGYTAYRISKTALNAVTRIFAAELRSQNITVHSICPGWVQTEMGGPNAERTPSQSVAGILPVLLEENPQQTGCFLRDGKPIAW